MWGEKRENLKINARSEFILKMQPAICKKTGKVKPLYKILRGGRNGGKSHDVATCLLLMGLQNVLRILCLREYQKNLRESVYTLLCDKIRSDPILSNFYRIMSDRIVQANPPPQSEGTVFLFSGIKNAKNVKSFEAADVCWVEEAQTISQDSLDILLPTIRKPGSQIIFTFNPYSETDPIYKFGVLNEMGFGDEILIDHEINYVDNPFCPANQVILAEQLREKDYDKYLHIWMGKPLKLSDAVIFKGKVEQREFDVTEDKGKFYFNGERIDYHYGWDFGFSTYSASPRSFAYNGDLYIDAEIYEKDLETDDIVVRLQEFMPELIRNREVIYGDGSRPETISQLSHARYHKNGFKLPALNIVAAIKGKNSVKEGITFLKNFRRIYVSPKCKNMLYEFANYKYKEVLQTGEILDEIVDKNNHLIDALRYAWNKEILAERRSLNISNDTIQKLSLDSTGWGSRFKY